MSPSISGFTLMKKRFGCQSVCDDQQAPGKIAVRWQDTDGLCFSFGFKSRARTVRQLIAIELPLEVFFGKQSGGVLEVDHYFLWSKLGRAFFQPAQQPHFAGGFLYQR